MHKHWPMIAAFICASAPAVAQSPIGFSQSGLIKLESLRMNGAQKDFVFGTYDMALRFAVTDQVKIGGDFGLDSVHLDGQSGGTAFATGVIDSPYGKLSAGIPRLVMPQFFDVPAMGGSEVLDVVQGLSSGELVRFMTYFSPGTTLRGLRYDGSFGKLTLAASVQEFDTKDRMIHAAAMHYDFGDFDLALGQAEVDMGIAKATTTKIALRGQKGRISGGVVASQQEFMGLWEKTLNGFVGYDIGEHITLDAQVFDIETVVDHYTAWGADVVYRHKTGLFVQGGVAQQTPKTDRITTVSMGYQF